MFGSHLGNFGSFDMIFNLLRGFSLKNVCRNFAQKLLAHTKASPDFPFNDCYWLELCNTSQQRERGSQIIEGGSGWLAGTQADTRLLMTLPPPPIIPTSDIFHTIPFSIFLLMWCNLSADDRSDVSVGHRWLDPILTLPNLWLAGFRWFIGETHTHMQSHCQFLLVQDRLIYKTSWNHKSMFTIYTTNVSNQQWACPCIASPFALCLSADWWQNSFLSFFLLLLLFAYSWFRYHYSRV